MASGGLSRLAAPGLHFPAPVPRYFRHYVVEKSEAVEAPDKPGHGRDLRLPKKVPFSRLIGTQRDTVEASRDAEGGPRPIRQAQGGLVQRRVRTLVQAVEIVTPVWDRVNERFGAPYQRIAHSGFVTPWTVGVAGSWEEEYAVDCSSLELKMPYEDLKGHGGSGVYVVFTAVEVAEKRGRHWVRLPWCSKLRIQEVAFVMDEEAAEEIAENVTGERIGGAGSDRAMAIPGCTRTVGREEMPERTVAVVRNRAGP
jgi:hypothetical protein